MAGVLAGALALVLGVPAAAIVIAVLVLVAGARDYVRTH